jgi:hypothetical protein
VEPGFVVGGESADYQVAWKISPTDASKDPILGSAQGTVIVVVVSNGPGDWKSSAQAPPSAPPVTLQPAPSRAWNSTLSPGRNRPRRDGEGAIAFAVSRDHAKFDG